MVLPGLQDHFQKHNLKIDDAVAVLEEADINVAQEETDRVVRNVQNQMHFANEFKQKHDELEVKKPVAKGMFNILLP